MSARERLVEAGVRACISGNGRDTVDDPLDAAAACLDAFLAHPDDLIELLVKTHGLSAPAEPWDSLLDAHATDSPAPASPVSPAPDCAPVPTEPRHRST